MSTEKLKRLHAAGWKTGSAEAFLGLSDEEAMLEFIKWLNAHSEDIVEADADQLRRIGKLVRGVKL